MLTSVSRALVREIQETYIGLAELDLSNNRTFLLRNEEDGRW